MKGLTSLAIGCTQLKCLRISECLHITDTGIKAVADHCPALQLLAACDCKLTYAGMAYLVTKCKDLSYSNSWKHIISSKEKCDLYSILMYICTIG
jgi:hypothetical protein